MIFSVCGAVLLCPGTSTPARAQDGVAGPPEVTVDLDVLNSLGREPRHGVTLRPPRAHQTAKPAPSHTATKKPPPKKTVAKPAPVKKAETKPVDREAAREETERAARAERQWEADRKAAIESKREELDRRAEADRKAAAERKQAEADRKHAEAERKRAEAERKRADADREAQAARMKREQAERMRQARAEIEEAAREATPPSSPGPRVTSSEKITPPGPGPVTPPPPAPSKVTIERAPTPAPAPKSQIAAVTPPPSSPPSPPATERPKPAALERTAGGTPRIEFAAGTADLTQSARTELDAIAKSLNADPEKRVQLVAYASGGNDEANQARRLSLSRALNVRAYLIDHGVRNTRMDVRALGNRSEANKPADRVDVLFVTGRQ